MSALSQNDDELTVINMIRAGCCAYFLKDVHAAELERALLEIYIKKDITIADFYNINYRRLQSNANKSPSLQLNDRRQRHFLELWPAAI